MQRAPSPISDFVSSLSHVFRVQTENPGLMRSQLEAFSRQIPLLYFIVIVSSDALALTHYGVAPSMLTVVVPATLNLVCLVRVWTWMKTRGQTWTDASLARRLKTTTWLAISLGAIFAGWGLSLYPYGDAYMQGHVAFFIGITVVSCIFCLMHLRPAALGLTVIGIVPFTIFFMTTGHAVYVAIALNMLLVAGAMVYILLTYSRDFANMIDYQKELVDTHIETKRLSNENLRLANLDSLTGLPNRRQFFSRLSESLNNASGGRSRFVVGMIDLDGFKSVNDVYGHTIGDRVLIEASERMRALCDETIFLARLGGDEFAMIVDADLDDAAITALGERFCDALDKSFHISGVIAQLSGSVGFATHPEAGAEAETLFESADYALYHAKQFARGRPVIFSNEQEKEIRKFSAIEQSLRSADLDAEMSLHFQPIFDTERSDVIAFEALARWENAKLGRVPPDVFVRVAERSDLINKLTQVLLRKALACVLAWPGDLRVSFNLSVRDLTSHEAILAISEIVRTSGVAPGRIDLEVTETALMRDIEHSSKSLRMLKSLGVRIALDDFGTGYSSLSYVHRLPIDKIKVDRSFIKDVETDNSCRAIVKTVIDLCRNLGLDCVIEGVETPMQALALQSLGCRTFQGYYYGRPMASPDVAGFVAKTRRTDRSRRAVS